MKSDDATDDAPFSPAQRREVRALLSKFHRGVVSESACNYHQCAIHICFSAEPPPLEVRSAESESLAPSPAEAAPNPNATGLAFLARSQDHPETTLLPDERIHEIQHSFRKDRVRLLWCCGSFMLVVAQCLTMAVIFWSTLNPSCAINDASAGCPTGHWCQRRAGYADAGYCNPCDDLDAEFCANLKLNLPSYDRRVPGDAETLFEMSRIDFTGWKLRDELGRSKKDAIETMCPSCYAPHITFSPEGSGKVGRTVEYRLTDAATANLERVQQIRRGDAIVIVVSSVLIGLAVSREIRDIQLCQLKQAQGDVIGRAPPRCVVMVFNIVHALRTFILIPSLVMTASVLVVFRGREAVAVCMNTVAILIVLDIDNYAYDFGLSEEMRAYFDFHDRVIISPHLARALDRTKKIHMALIPAAICWGVFAQLYRNVYVAFIGGLLGCCFLTTPLGFSIDRILRRKVGHGRSRRQVGPGQRGTPQEVQRTDGSGHSCAVLLCDVVKIWCKGLANIIFLVFVVFVVQSDWGYDEEGSLFSNSSNSSLG